MIEDKYMINSTLFPSFNGNLIIHKEPSKNPQITGLYGDIIKDERIKKSVQRLLDDTYNHISEDQMKKIDKTSNTLKEIVENKLPPKDTVTFNFHMISETRTTKLSSGFFDDLLGRYSTWVKIIRKPGYKLKYIPDKDSASDFKNSEIILPVELQ